MMRTSGEYEAPALPNSLSSALVRGTLIGCDTRWVGLRVQGVSRLAGQRFKLGICDVLWIVSMRWVRDHMATHSELQALPVTSRMVALWQRHG